MIRVNLSHSSAGFTLLETLVALAISALCLVMLSGIVSRLVGAGKAISSHAAVLDEGGAVMRLIAGLVGSVDLEMRDASRPNLNGDERHLEVLSSGPAPLDLNAQAIFNLRFTPTASSSADASGTISLEWTAEASGVPVKETIATGIRSFELAYRGKGIAGSWINNWSRSVSDLALVKATITFSAAQGNEPITSVFAVHSKLPQICVLNPLRQGCQLW